MGTVINKYFLKEKALNLRDELTWGILQKFIDKYPKLENPIIGIILFTSFLVSFFGGISIINFVWPTKGLSSNTGTVLSASAVPVAMSTENPIEKRVNDNKVGQVCLGREFDILEDLSNVGGEKLSFPDRFDDHIASPAGDLFQGSKKTSWECSLPLISTVSAIPKSEKSVGLFWEFENLIKITTGDGDNRSFRIEVNENGDRGPWPSHRIYLDKKIKKNKELVVTYKLKEIRGLIKIVVEIFQVGWDGPIIVNDLPLARPSLIVKPDTSKRIRVGINDWLNKGLGSQIRLQTLTIKTEEW